MTVYCFSILTFLSFAYYIAAFLCTLTVFRKKGKETEMPHLEGISFLKPITGEVYNLYNNIKSFLDLRAIPIEMLFGVSSKDDPAYDILTKLENEFPGICKIILCNNHKKYSNEKVGKLITLTEHARYDIINISDADVLVPQDFLQSLTHIKNAGMVTNLYRGIHNEGIGGHLEVITILSDIFQGVCMAKIFHGINYGFGASMFLTKQSLESIGGYEALGNMLADDYHLGNKISKNGKPVTLSTILVNTVVGKSNFKNYFVRQLRLCKTYRVSKPVGYFLFGISFGSVWSLLLCFLTSFSLPAISLFGTAIIMRFLSITLTGTLLSKIPFSWVYLLVPIQEFLGFYTWLLSFCGNKITWKNKKFVLGKDGTIAQINPE